MPSMKQRHGRLMGSRFRSRTRESLGSTAGRQNSGFNTFDPANVSKLALKGSGVAPMARA